MKDGGFNNPTEVASALMYEIITRVDAKVRILTGLLCQDRRESGAGGGIQLLRSSLFDVGSGKQE